MGVKMIAMTTRLTDTESALVADIAAAHRPALVEDWIQESPDLAVLIGDELLHDVEFVTCIRRLCEAIDPTVGYFHNTNSVSITLAAGHRLAQLVRQQADRCHGDELVDAEIQRATTSVEETRRTGG